jgi:hypothetical protein
MSRIKTLLFVLALAAQVPLASAKVTYQVGGCLPKLPTSATIQGALNASPPPDVVEVCPGVYNEQVIITNPVTLEGVSFDNAAQILIGIPPTGLTTTTDDLGDTLAPQVWVESGGKVDLINLLVDGGGSSVPSADIFVGVLYKNTSGTLNHLWLLDQVNSGNGVGVWLEGGSANPSVTIENSFFYQFDDAGIVAETSSSTPQLTATITGNSLDGSEVASYFGIYLFSGVDAAATGNFAKKSYWGIYAASKGSVSKNTIEATNYGIEVDADDVSVTSNTVLEATYGLLVESAVAPVTDNTIIFSPVASIDFNCTAGNNVHSNTILSGPGFALINLPAGANPANMYYNLTNINGGGC